MTQTSEAPPAKKKEKPIVQQLVELAEKEFDLFMDERGVAYASYSNGNGTDTMPVRSEEMDVIWRDLFRKKKGVFVNNEQMTNAKAYVTATARADKKQLKTRFNYVHRGRQADIISIHLSDPGHFVEIKPRTIRQVRNGPILFRSFKHQKALDFSSNFMSVQQTLKWINVKSPSDQLLLLVWLVLAPFECIPRPLLVLTGPQGAAKTTTAKVLRSLLDPSNVPVLTPKENQVEWALALFQHAVPIFDNLGKLQPWQADMLCKAVTGDGISKRTLYTNEDTTILSYQRAIIMSGINLPSVQPDLLDRSLLIELDRIPPEERKAEAKLWEDFDAVKPRIVGGLFKTISRTLRMFNPNKKLPLTRMADFAALGCAAARAMGYTEKQFLAALQLNLERQNQQVLESEPLARAIIRLVKSCGGFWEGTAGQLSSDLKDIVGRRTEDGDEDFAPNIWQPRSLGRHLRELQATFIDYGIHLSFIRQGKAGVRLIRLDGRGNLKDSGFDVSLSAGRRKAKTKKKTADKRLTSTPKKVQKGRRDRKKK